MPSSMTPNRRPTVTPPHVVSAEPSADPSKKKSWIRKIRRLRLREGHRTKLVGVLAEMLEDNLALAFLPTLRNRKKVIAELKQEFEYWALYGPISDEEKEEKEKDKKRTVGDFIKNWCNPNIEFLIFSYFAKSPFKQQLIDQVTGDGQRRGRWWKDLGVTNPNLLPGNSHRERMEVKYTVCRERPWRWLCGGYGFEHTSIWLKFPINPIVKLLWNVMRKKDSGKNVGVDYAMLSKDLAPILEMNNIGRNKTHRKRLASSLSRFGGSGDVNRPAVVRLLMSI